MDDALLFQKGTAVEAVMFKGRVYMQRVQAISNVIYYVQPYIGRYHSVQTATLI